MRLPLLLMFCCCAVACPQDHGQAHAEEDSAAESTPRIDPQVQQVLDAWREAGERFESVELTWQQIEDEASQFSRYRTYWARADSQPPIPANRLQIDGSKFRYQSERPTFGPHTIDAISNETKFATWEDQFTPLTQYKERLFPPADFLYALVRKFDPNLELEYGSFQPFTRVFDGILLVDRWHRTESTYPRITVRKAALPGSLAWARLTPEYELEYQLDTLSLEAALVGCRRLGSLPIAVRPEDLRLRDEEKFVNGHACLVLEERVTGSPHFRTFWVDAKRDFIVLRVIGEVMTPGHEVKGAFGREIVRTFGDTLIQLEYERHNTLGWAPTRWQVVSLDSMNHPPQAFARFEVTDITRPKTDLESVIQEEARTDVAGAWIVDETNGSQFILRSNGQRRDIQPSELELYPTYDQLSSYAPEQLEQSIIAQQSPPRIQRTLVWFGLALIQVGILLWLRRRKPGCNTAATEQTEAAAQIEVSS